MVKNNHTVFNLRGGTEQMLSKYLKNTIHNIKNKEAFDINNTIQVSKGLIVLEKSMVERINNTVYLKQATDQLYIYPYEKDTYNILKEVFPTKKICRITFQYNESITLDFTNYNSIQDTYNILRKQGYSIENDKELIAKATQKLIPRKRIIRMKQKLGQKAFEGSSIKQYELTVLKCLDRGLIYEISNKYNISIQPKHI